MNLERKIFKIKRQKNNKINLKKLKFLKLNIK